jgi:tocopherol cyclase
MIKHIRSVLNPDAYHGFDQTSPYFEGWYFKLVDSSEQERWCIIPGVYLGKNPADTHAFIQVMNGVSGQSIYQPYPYDSFHTPFGKFEIHIQDNLFTAQHIIVNIIHPDLQVVGDLLFEGVTPWPVTWISPGIMGWYGWVPGMECYHGVVSLNHTIRGWLEINQKKIDFTRGTGYIEKDWGKSFPKAWVWMQTNHFNHLNTCLTASAAIIPWGKRTFDGFIAGLLLDGKLHRFATYSGARLEDYSIKDHEANLVFSDRNKRLELLATRAEGGLLQAPTLAQMDRRIAETLSAQVEVRLLSRKGKSWAVEFEDTGRHAGLEVIGELNR